MSRLEDTDSIKNAFEITGTFIERITAVCQGPNEANKWVELLSSDSNGSSMNLRASELSKNMSSSAISIPHPPPHVSTLGRIFEITSEEQQFEINSFCARIDINQASGGISEGFPSFVSEK